MKKICLLLLTTLLLACKGEQNKLTLSGHYDGLEQGDTLFLTTILLPHWEEITVDTFYASKPEEFVFDKKLDETTMFSLTHRPKDAPAIDGYMRGDGFVAKPGDKIHIRGSVYSLGASTKTGGFYADSLVARLDSMESAFYNGLITCHRKLQTVRESGQQDSINKYQKACQSIRRPKAMKELNEYIAQEVNDLEYSAYLYFYKLNDVTGAQLEERFNKYTPDIQASDMGRQLQSTIRILKNIEPGNFPSEFSLKDMNGNVVKLSDYRGKYLLIYNWGLCPGVMWVHPKILSLYKAYHDKDFEVIGTTGYDFFTVHADLKSYSDIEPLFNQPWPTVFTDTPGNEFIAKDYFLNGTPILMLISPEGKTLSRGYNEVYDDIKSILEENL